MEKNDIIQVKIPHFLSISSHSTFHSDTENVFSPRKNDDNDIISLNSLVNVVYEELKLLSGVIIICKLWKMAINIASPLSTCGISNKNNLSKTS